MINRGSGLCYNLNFALGDSVTFRYPVKVTLVKRYQENKIFIAAVVLSKNDRVC